MAKIRAIDLRLIEDAFAMSGGYVLDFSNRSFSQFFNSEVGIDIDSQRYLQNGPSKANRLRAFLQIEPEPLVARALRALWEYADASNGPADSKDDKARHQEARFFQLVRATDGKGGLVGPQASGHAPCTLSSSPQAVADLQDRLLKLSALKAQNRGFAFERFLSDLFALYGLAPRNSFRLIGEQIDGSFQIGQEVYLLEAKWQDAPTGQADLLIFAGKVDGKATGALGLFVSYSGFSADGLQAFARGRRTSILCMDGLDLAQVLSGHLSFTDVIGRKRRRALETNNAFVPVRDLFSSVI